VRPRDVSHGSLAKEPFRWPGWAYVIVVGSALATSALAWVIVASRFSDWATGAAAA
jgi:hypothetical protein